MAVLKRYVDLKNDIDRNKEFKSNSFESNSSSENFKDEKQLMDEVLSLMRKGYSRIKASQEVGIKIGQL